LLLLQTSLQRRRAWHTQQARRDATAWLSPQNGLVIQCMRAADWVGCASQQNAAGPQQAMLQDCMTTPSNTTGCPLQCTKHHQQSVHAPCVQCKRCSACCTLPLTCMMFARSISRSFSARKQRSRTANACSRVRLPALPLAALLPTEAMPGGRKGSR
jgi:hypothetical protein